MTAQQSPSGASSRWTEAGALAEANQVDDWLAVEPDGTIIVFSGKVELGTGVRTALAWRRAYPPSSMLVLPAV